MRYKICKTSFYVGMSKNSTFCIFFVHQVHWLDLPRNIHLGGLPSLWPLVKVHHGFKKSLLNKNHVDQGLPV